MPARLTKKRGGEAIAAALRDAKRIAIVRLGSIGDVVATIPLAWFLRDILGPDVKISWIVHSASAHLLHSVGAIDEVVSIPKGSFLTWKRILANRRPDVVIDVHGNLKSGVVSLLSGARTRVGFHRRDCREHWNPLFTNLKLPRLASNNKTRRAVEIAEILGHPRPSPRFELDFEPAERKRADEVLAGIETGSRPLAVLQLGRVEDVRSWPPESCARFCSRLLEADYSVLVLGGPPEEETGEQVRDLLPETPGRLHFEINTLTLREVGALLSAVASVEGTRNVFIGGDSGCLHLAAGCGLRSIGLFGPQDPMRTAPVGDHVEIVYRPEVATCIPCSRRECFHETWSFCMKSITPEEVAGQVIGSGAGATGSAREETAGEPDRVDPTATDVAGRCGDAPEPATGHPLGTGRDIIWILLLTSTLLALRCIQGSPLATADRFPGLGRLLDQASPVGHVLSVLSGTGLAFLTYLMGRRLGAPGTGALAAGLLAATALFLDLSRMSPGGGLFVLVINLGFLLFIEGEIGAGGRRRWAGPVSAVAAFVAFLLQGLLGVLLPAFAVVTFRAGEKAMGKLLRPRALVPAALVATGIAATFFAMRASWTDATEFRAAFFEPLTRSGDASSPVWAYVRWLALRCLPAAVLAPPALFAHLKNRRYREDLGFADRRWRYSKSVFLSGIALVSLMPLKSPLYLIALLPALSILSAAWLEKRWEEWAAEPRGGDRARLVSRLFVVAAALTLGSLVLVGPVQSRGAERWILAGLFIAGCLLASRASPTTASGLSLRVALAAVVTAAAMP